VLPPAKDLLDKFTTDTSLLNEARSDVETLSRNFLDDSSQANLLNALPALRETTSVVRNATEYFALYPGASHDLIDEVAVKIEDYRLSWMNLLIFVENSVDEVAIHDVV
jgi:secreted trypsin-like serine protease